MITDILSIHRVRVSLQIMLILMVHGMVFFGRMVLVHLEHLPHFLRLILGVFWYHVLFPMLKLVIFLMTAIVMVGALEEILPSSSFLIPLSLMT